jgi:murein DD-endopeptidase MepM/ murein hydrolase activator NlpD
MEHRIPQPETAAVYYDDAYELSPPLPELRSVYGHFGRNQTITQVLLAEGLSVETVHEIITAAKPIYNLARVHAGRLYQLFFTEDGKLHDFRYHVNDSRYLTVSRCEEHGGFVPSMEEHPFETRVEHISATINSSLFAAVSGIGERQSVAVDISNIFVSDIDFNRGIRRGDSFTALIERKYLNGEFVRNGAILAASFTNRGRTFTGFRFDDENGRPAYYAPDGSALRRAFLRAPLQIIRITSGFSQARMHPIQRVVRPHLGVDYAAPTGTPVMAVGAGTVTTAGWTNGGGGNTIFIRHANGFETRYLHLSRILVKRGQRVNQGDIIGHVGATGDATGPHLCFRVLVNGRPVDPTTVVFPPGEPIAGERMAEFIELRDHLMDQLGDSSDLANLADLIDMTQN